MCSQPVLWRHRGHRLEKRQLSRWTSRGGAQGWIIQMKATFYDNIMVRCPPCSKMQNTTGTAFPLEVSGILLKNQSAVIAPNLKRFVCVTLWRWSGLGRSQLQRRGQTLQSNQGFSESRKYNAQRRKAVQKYLLSKNSRRLPVSGMTIQMTLKMNAVK